MFYYIMEPTLLEPRLAHSGFLCGPGPEGSAQENTALLLQEVHSALPTLFSYLEWMKVIVTKLFVTH